MILDDKATFKCTLLEDDPRTMYKAGHVIFPKGVYWNGKNVILVGNKNGGTVRLSFPANIIEVEVM
jgi:hypothetical protein